MRRAAAVALAAWLCAGCTPIVRYTDELVSARSGRTFLTRTPATFGGIVGFIAGVPVDIVALPVTYVVYSAQDEVTRDPLSIFLFPSFVLWRVGTLVGAPIDSAEDSAVLSPDGRVVATFSPGSEEGTIQLWDVRTRGRLGPPLRWTSRGIGLPW